MIDAVSKPVSIGKPQGFCGYKRVEEIDCKIGFLPFFKTMHCGKTAKRSGFEV
jgi:hypothetical protein